MGEKFITPGGNHEHNKKLDETKSQLFTNFDKLPEGFVIGKFQFEKKGYKDASINEAIIMRLSKLIQDSESLDEKVANTSILTQTVRKLIQGEKARTTSDNDSPQEVAVNEILLLDKLQQVHGGQSLNRLDLQNILNLLLINENNHSVIKEGELVNPSLQGSLSELIRKISLLDRYGYDYADDVKNDNGDIKSKIKDIKFTALGNIKEAIRVSEEIALAKKRKEEHKE